MPEKKLKVIEIDQSSLKLSLISQEIAGNQAALVGSRTLPRPGLVRVGDDTSAFCGNGNVNLLCGRCDAILARKVRRGQLWQMILLCNHCHAVNDAQGCGVSNRPQGQAVQF